MPINKKHFELTILGCSGGPISGKTCSFLLKPADIDYKDIINDPLKNDCLLAIDAGTGLTSIVDILNDKHNVGEYLKNSFIIELYPENFNKNDNLCETIFNTVKKYTNLKNLSILAPFDSLKNEKLKIPDNLSSFQLADKILNSINSYLITHPHLDHVASLVINSPSFSKPKKVVGISDTVDSIKNNLFNGSIWPDLVKSNIISLTKIKPNLANSSISNRYDITPLVVSHGVNNNNNDFYKSTAFLINDKVFNYKLLIFGDVESDNCSNLSLNENIWKFISPSIISNDLNSIIIECSTIDKPPPLFGHMTPSNLFFEFLKLRKICIDLKNPKFQKLNMDDEVYSNFTDQPLDGLNVLIIHVKETLESINPRSKILNHLNRLNKLHNTKINFTIALSGLSVIL